MIALAGLACLVIAGGASTARSSARSSLGSPGTAASGPVKGGTLTVLDSAGGVDSLDPAYWYYQTDYAELMQTTQRELYTFTARGTTPVPDLATALPAVSNDGKTLTIQIRPGIHYSPPLANETVTSADVKYALERCFLSSAGSDNYASSYYNEIVGAPKAHVRSVPTIAGLRTPNPTTLVIETKTPVGVLADANALALPCTTPVPQSYAARYDRGASDTYGMHQLFTGPYMIKGAGTGTVPSSSYLPDEMLILTRNPSWVRASDPIRGAYVDEIDIEDVPSPDVAARTILAGRDMISGDSPAPPESILRHGLAGSEQKQFSIGPSGGNRYISLNTTVRPFNNVWVRRAVSAVIDRNALRMTHGNAALGTLATHFLPPGVPGFAQAGGRGGPRYPWVSHPDGDLALAKRYMQKAGYTHGIYTGSPILSVASTGTPDAATARLVRTELAQIGLRLNLHLVPYPTMLSKYCEVTAAKIGVCPYLGWAKDFDDAQSMIEPVFSSAALGPATTNMAQVNNPALTRQINHADQLTNPTRRAQAWGKLDDEVTGQSYVVTWLWDNQIVYGSSNVHRATWAFNGNDPDYVDSWLTP